MDSIPCQNGWRPIETAPKDRLILVYIVRGKKKFSFYDVTRWIDWQDGDGYWAGVDGDERATHWHPLPKPPGEITN